MHLKKLILIVSILIITFTGCAQKTQIRAIQSAKVTDSAIKNIGILPFKNDNISQSSQIDSAISSVNIKGENFFNVVDRSNIKRVMKEKKLNESGVVNLVNDNNDLGIAQMETIVSGRVISATESISNYTEQRTDYNSCIKYKYYRNGKKSCQKYRKYIVHCSSKNFTVKTKIKLTRVSDSSVMFGKTYSASSKSSHCNDDNHILPSKKEATTDLAGVIAKDLVIDIAPSYIYFTVTLLDDPDIDYTDQQEKQLKIALKLIDKKRVEKANEILKNLNKSLNSRSYVALYNLALTEESLGNVENAYSLYKKAEDIALMSKVVEEISIAIERSKQNLAELRRANKQIN